MTETDFFRIARERMGDYTITITRESKLGKKPYSVALLREGQTLYSDGETLGEALSDIAARAGVDRRRAPRGDYGAAQGPDDAIWPNG